MFRNQSHSPVNDAIAALYFANQRCRSTYFSLLRPVGPPVCLTDRTPHRIALQILPGLHESQYQPYPQPIEIQPNLYSIDLVGGPRTNKSDHQGD